MAAPASPLVQTLGNTLSGLAALVVFWPLSRLLSEFSTRYPSDNQWVTTVWPVLVPLWLLLGGALLCLTASGGFDWLRLGRPVLYGLSVGAAVALATATFIGVAFYIRPGFTPRGLYVPLIYAVPLATIVLVTLTLNVRALQGVPPAWLRLPWTIFTVISMIACGGFVGHRVWSGGMGTLRGFAYRITNPAPSAAAVLAQLDTLDAQRDFDTLLRRTGRGERREVRDAVTAKLRTHPSFVDSLTARLNSRDPEDALAFLHGATLTAAEQRAWALPARQAMELVISDIPAPNYMPSNRRAQIRRWGRGTLPVIIEKFAGTGVDFSRIMRDLEHALRPDDTRR